MSSTQFTLSIVIAVVIGGLAAFLLWKQRQIYNQGLKEEDKMNAETRQLQLQAYERLILLAERIALPNLISRVNVAGMSLQEAQYLLVNNIKQEFDYNVTQQIYVTQQSWEALRNLKEQNILIINQVASFLPAEAQGKDLSRSILEMLSQNPNASLHAVATEVLSFEAKKLLK